MVDLKFLVTGTGRCGTLFMSNLLTSAGFPCTHEAIFTTNGIEWAKKVVDGEEAIINSKISRGDCLSDAISKDEIVAESSFMAAPFLKQINADIIHVVRNPINVVGSMIGQVFKNFSNPHPTNFEEIPDHIVYEKFIYDHLPELSKEMPQIDRGCLFYLLWNRMIEESGKVKFFHRIEDETTELREFIGCKANEWYSNKKCNSFSSSKKWKIQDIKSPKIRDEIADMMKRYGYNLKIFN
jgi:hypothetical protein